MLMMVISKNTFFGICAISLITISLYMNSFINNDSKSLSYWMGHIKNSYIFKKISGQAECSLPLEWTLEKNFLNSSQPIPVLHLKENDICLELLIKEHCFNDKRVIPKVVHYIHFDKRPVQFYAFFSFLSVLKHIKPCFIVVHGDAPLGPMFEKFLTYKPRIIHIGKTSKQMIFGKNLSSVQHQADVARLEVIIKYGGIYLDQDQIVLKSFDPLLNHSVVLGYETFYQFGNAVIIAKPSSLFLRFWLATYRGYDPTKWAVQSTMVPFRLSKFVPKMVFVVRTFFKPNFDHLHTLYRDNINWTDFYAIHMYRKDRYDLGNFESIRYKNNTFSSVARYIYYGDKTLQIKNISTTVKPRSKKSKH